MSSRTVAVIREKQHQAWLLHVAGGMTLENVARTPFNGKPMYANKSGAYKAVQAEIRRRMADQAATYEEKREMLDARADAARERAMRIVNRPPPVLYKGTPVMVDGQPLLDEGVRLQALAETRQIDEAVAKRNGLILPVRVEHSGPDGAAIPISVRAEELNERFGVAARLKALPAGDA